eukprot:110695_1
MTQKRNEDIHVDQGKLEYKQSVEHWREQCKQMDAHLGNKCIWGPFTKQEMEREKILKDYKIMPHFVNERLKDDGSTKYRLVTDAKSKQKNGMNLKACFARKDLQDLMRKINEICIKYRFYRWIKWISTDDNLDADGLSRFKQEFIDKIDAILQNKDKQAIDIAKIGLSVYKKARIKMARS